MALPPSLDSSDTTGTKSRLFSARKHFLWLGLALAVSLLLYHLKIDFIESYLYDLRVRLTPAPASTDKIELVLINPSTIEELKTSPHLGHHMDFLKKIDSVGPMAIVYDQSLREYLKDPLINEFAEYTKLLPTFMVLSDSLQVRGEAPLLLPPPLEHIPLKPGPKSSDLKNFAKDGVTRRFLIDYQGQRTLHVELAQRINPDISNIQNIRGAFDFLGTFQSYIHFHEPSSFPTVTFADVLFNRVDLNRYKNKIIIVGVDTQMSERDYASTPFSRESIGMTSAEVHANIIETLIRNDAPIKSPPLLNFFLILIVSILTVYVVFSAKPARGLLILASTLLVFLGLSWLMFWPFGYWTPLAHPLLALFLSYYFFIPYRLIMENRRSWEIFQKHQLLKQLEELKTNFISMMSHDLKTPIARIQGMADIIQRNPNPLDNPQREALDTIRASSDDLLKFINAILQYGKIEAQQIVLNKQSKDINNLIHDVIKKHEFLAKLKKMTLITELETLFPVSIDPDLMKQVFSNLLENAIKYSPEDSRVLVTSEEQQGRIIIQFSDQGPGIPEDEIPHLFMKFFRSKNAKSSPIKGSGLGLYLARYFTELHGGRLFVESSYGQGSTFTVELPVVEK